MKQRWKGERAPEDTTGLEELACADNRNSLRTLLPHKPEEFRASVTIRRLHCTTPQLGTLSVLPLKGWHQGMPQHIYPKHQKADSEQQPPPQGL